MVTLKVLAELLEPGLRQLAYQEGVHNIRVDQCVDRDLITVTLWNSRDYRAGFTITRTLIENDQYGVIVKHLEEACAKLVGAPEEGSRDGIQDVVNQEVNKLNGR